MTIYRVNDLYPAIQGEGCQTGVPMALLRLHGCGVGCPWCDTKETWTVDQQHKVNTLADALGSNASWCELSGSEIAYHVRQEYPALRWVLLTGGEPADQDLQALCFALHDAGFLIALETSGTANGHLKANIDWICVSPKINMPGGKTILPEVVASADEIKYVVGKPKDIKMLDQLLADCPTKTGAVICLQPVSMSQKATELCLKTVMERGWRLSIQVHKLLNQR